MGGDDVYWRSPAIEPQSAERASLISKLLREESGYS